VIVFVIIVTVWLWTLALFVASRVALQRTPEAGPTDELLWMFLVPALNEEVTIADSVDRLLAVEAGNRAVLVIDDGSTDGTGAVLAGIDHPDLAVLHRVPPDARKGKAAALNAAWRHLEQLLSAGRWAGWPRDRVVVVVVDADGRLDPRTPELVAGRFADARVGGVQVLVRIYNRSRLLTWFQDVEFSVYGFLYQCGRSPAGIAGMGGNGQCNRLAALDAIADPEPGGPWRDRLTEDQDLGLRLIEAGWLCEQETRATVNQQGLPGLRRLFRQRTRWAQGNLQAMGHIGAMLRLERPWYVRFDLAAYLLLPAIHAVVGLAFLASIVLAITGAANFWGNSDWWVLLFFFLLGYGGVLMGCIARGASRGVGGIVRGIFLAPVYAAYTWLLWPVLARAAARHFTHRSDWAKTAREPLAKRPG
jgi:cellulose synthase/poly-beta-1,6-N-acetylglucosamine synthase-like glycosyltransferase